MSAHRYWRVYCTALNGRNYAGCDKLQMFTAVGSADACTGGTPLFSTQGFGAASNAFDTNSGTFWASSNGALPEYLGYDLGAGNAKDLVGFSWKPRNDSFGPSDAPSAGSFQYSDDGTTWTTLFSFSGSTSWGQTETRTFFDPALPIDSTVTTKSATSNLCGDLSAYHRYWRMYVTAVGGKSDGSFGLRELELRETLGGADLTSPTTTITADTSFSGFTPSSVIDNSFSTQWSSNTGGLPHWLRVDFGSLRLVNEVAFAPRGGTDINQTPLDWDLQYSDDDSAWTTKFRVRGYAEVDGTSNALSVLNGDFGVQTTTPKYQAWRVRMTSTAGGALYSLAQIELRDVNGADLTGTGKGYSIADSTYGSEVDPPSHAFNDSASTSNKYSAVDATSGRWIGWLFNAPVDVRGLLLRARGDNSQNQAPAAFSLQYWDGSAWQDSALSASGLSWTLGETKTWDVPGVATRSASTTSATAAVGTGSNDATVTTKSATSVAASAGVAADATSATSSASTVAASASSVSPGDTTVTTKSASTVAASAGVALDATAATSQAQSVSALTAVASAVAVATSSASTSAASLSATTTWTVTQSGVDLLDNSSGQCSFTNSGINTLFSGATTSGHAIVVMVFGYWRSDGCTISVSDDAGNTYTAGTQHVAADASPTVHARFWMQAFYATNITGSSTPTFGLNITQTGTILDLPSRLHIAAFEVNCPANIALDVEDAKFTTSSTTTLTSNAFTTLGGAVFGAEVNFFGDSKTSSTVNFDANYTDLVRPLRNPGTGDTDTTFGAAGYRVSASPLTSTTATFTGSASDSRGLLMVAFKDAPAGATTDSTVTTSSAQSAAAVAQVAYNFIGSTSQAQSVAAVAGVSVSPGVTTKSATTVAAAAAASADASVATSGASTASAAGTVAWDAQAATSSASTQSGELVLPAGVTTSSASSAAAVAGIDSPVSATTKSATSAAAVAGVSVDAQSATQTAQTASGSTNVASAMSGSTSSATRLGIVAFTDSPLSAGSMSSTSSAAGVLVVDNPVQAATRSASTAAAAASVNTDFNAATRTASRVSALARAESNNAVQTSTASTVAAVAGVSTLGFDVATAQAQSTHAAVGVAVDAVVATSSASRADVVALGEWIVAAATAQAQTQSGALGVESPVAAGTRSATTAAAQVGVAVDMTVATASFARMEYGRLDVVQDMTVSTSSVTSALLALADVYDTPTAYDLVCELRLFDAVGGACDIQPAVAGGSRVFAAVEGDADARPL